MEYPSLPTDNLYKFMALAGLALAIVSVVYSTSKVIELEVSIAESNFQLEMLKFEVSKIDKLFALESQKNIPSQDISLMSEKNDQGRLKYIEMEKTLNLVSNQRYWSRLYIVSSVIGGLFGIFLSSLGFRMWYLRVQKPIDQLLQKQISHLS